MIAHKHKSVDAKQALRASGAIETPLVDSSEDSNSDKDYLKNFDEQLDSDMVSETEVKISDEVKEDDLDYRAADLIITKVIIQVLKERIHVLVGKELYEKHLRDDPLFEHRNELLYHLHKDLLSESTDGVLNFVGSYSNYLKAWIEKKAIDICMFQNTMKKIFHKCWDTEKKKVIAAVVESEKEAQLGKPSLSWYQDLINRLKGDAQYSKV